MRRPVHDDGRVVTPTLSKPRGELSRTVGHRPAISAHKLDMYVLVRLQHRARHCHARAVSGKLDTERLDPLGRRLSDRAGRPVVVRDERRLQHPLIPNTATLTVPGSIA